MNIKLLKEIERKFHLGHFHDEKYLQNKQVLNMNLFKVLKYLCACGVKDEDVEVVYNPLLGDDNVFEFNNQIRKLESEGKIFEALIQCAYSCTIDANNATKRRKNRGVEVYNTNWENYLAEQTMMIKFQEDIHKSFQSFERFKSNFFKDLEENKLKSETYS